MKIRKMFYHPLFFWLGCSLITLGVLSHIPMFLHSASMGFRMVGMQMGFEMWLGMGLIPIGLLFSAYGLYPGSASASRVDIHKLPQLKISESSILTAEHWRLIFVLFVAVAVDVMKPATLGFVLPGMADEYNISHQDVGKLVLIALVGTALGSVLWGIASDRIGRRATILLSALMFIGTAICGAMPSFQWNLSMCFLMGMSAGGLLPITFALMAETVPARYRGWLLVGLGGFGTGAGYLLASSASAILEPMFSWRVLWLLGLPTGLMIVFLNRFIPESPRYLIGKGRMQEANSILSRFSCGIESQKLMEEEECHRESKKTLSSIFKGKYFPLSLALMITSICWGIVNFGFLLWLPTNLRTYGFLQEADFIIAQSALVALPAMIVVVVLYHAWSSIRTLVVFVVLTGVSLLLFCALAWFDLYAENVLLLLITILLISVSGLIAMLIPYAAEIYPVEIRGAGVGLVAGGSKIGGILGSIMGMLGMFDGAAEETVFVALVLFLSGYMLIRSGINTRGLDLEDIHNRITAGEIIKSRSV